MITIVELLLSSLLPVIQGILLYQISVALIRQKEEIFSLRYILKEVFVGLGVTLQTILLFLIIEFEVCLCQSMSNYSFLFIVFIIILTWILFLIHIKQEFIITHNIILNGLVTKKNVSTFRHLFLYLETSCFMFLYIETLLFLYIET